MFIGVTRVALDFIRRAFPDDCEEMRGGHVLIFGLGYYENARDITLILGSIEPENVRLNCPKLSVEGRSMYFDVKSDVLATWNKSVLHFDAPKGEFEAVEILLADDFSRRTC